jgi:hypothetical protein
MQSTFLFLHIRYTERKLYLSASFIVKITERISLQIDIQDDQEKKLERASPVIEASSF